MIEIKRNRSFPGWFDVIVNGQMIDEVQGRMKALRLAKKVAHQQNIDYVASLATTASESLNNRAGD